MTKNTDVIIMFVMFTIFTIAVTNNLFMKIDSLEERVSTLEGIRRDNR